MAVNDPLTDERVHENLVGSSDFGDTGELFYTPVVSSLQSDDDDDGDGPEDATNDAQMTESMSFEAKRAELKYPRYSGNEGGAVFF